MHARARACVCMIAGMREAEVKGKVGIGLLVRVSGIQI